MSKQDKLIQVLTDAANVVTPYNGNSSNNDPVYYTTAFDPTAALVEVSYRIGRALTLARSIARDSD